MEAPSYLLHRPLLDWTLRKIEAFDELWNTTPVGCFIDYQLHYPKWDFLSYLCESKELVLHGSQNQDIDEVQPRQANDKRAFSNQHAIYATTDGIWVIYYAILNRVKYPEMS